MINSKDKEILRRYPRLTGHLIAESLGYFTVGRAVDAIRAHKDNKEWCCEWYMDIKLKSGKTYTQINQEVIKSAFINRHYHKGAMASYKAAKALVMRALNNQEVPILVSWF